MDLPSLHSEPARIARWWPTAVLAFCAGTTTADAKNSTANYAEAILGTWMPEDVACSSPVNYDSDSLIDIGRNELGYYEDLGKATHVVQVSETPPAWRIDSLLNVGGDGYNRKVSELFVLSGDRLIIAGTDGFETYARCK